MQKRRCFLDGEHSSALSVAVLVAIVEIRPILPKKGFLVLLKFVF